MKKLSEKNLPTTLDEAVEMVIASLTEEDKRIIRITPGWHIKAHSGYGRYLRNIWGFWNPESTTLRRWFAENLKVAHPDDMSGTILKAVWRKMRDEPFDAPAHVKGYVKHWTEYKCDPLVGDSAPIKKKS